MDQRTGACQTFGGVVSCDYVSAYRKYMADAAATVQFCLAHLIREVRFLTEHTDVVLVRWGNKLLDHLRNLVTVHGFAGSSDGSAWRPKCAATLSFRKAKAERRC